MKKSLIFLFTCITMITCSLGYYAMNCQAANYPPLAWPTIHRDSRNSDYLPLPTTDHLESKWHALQDDYSAVLTAAVIGPEGNIYFTTGKEEEYGNLHAFDHQGHELWRSYLLDFGAFSSSPLIDQKGDLYLGDLDEYMSFHPDGTLKWRCSKVEGPFASSAFLPNGAIVCINKNGWVYLLDPLDGEFVAEPFELPGQSPAVSSPSSPPPGLWEGMIINEENLSEDAFWGLMGSHFKITNTPAVNPFNGRIYIVGTIQADIQAETISSEVAPFSRLEGRLFGIDFLSGQDQNQGRLALAFQTPMGAGSGSSPAISPDGLTIYVLDGAGTLYAFDADGQKRWTLEVRALPASPTIGSDGTIYCAGGSTLSAIVNHGDYGSLAWQLDFEKTLLNYLPRLPHDESIVESSLFSLGLAKKESNSSQETHSSLRCNSVVSISQNYIYLTVALGYEILPEGKDKPYFLTTRCFLVVLPVPCPFEKPSPLIISLVELPDTTEGIITLDKDGTVLCAHASMASSIAYALSQKAGLNLRKPVGGVSVLGPKNQQDFLQKQLKWLKDHLAKALDDTLFQKKNQRERLIFKINLALKMINLKLYQYGLDIIEKEILPTTDGCAKAGIPDENDWITDCETQDQLYPTLSLIIEGLKEQMVTVHSHPHLVTDAGCWFLDAG